MFGFLAKIFTGLITSIVNVSNNAKYVSLNNQKVTTQPSLINLHPNEYTEGLRYGPFAINLDRWVRSCNTLNGLSNKAWVPKKTEDLNLKIFNMITETNESKTLTKHISCELKCKFDECKNVKIWKNIMFPKKIIFGVLLHLIVKMVNIYQVLLMI